MADPPIDIPDPNVPDETGSLAAKEVSAFATPRVVPLTDLPWSLRSERFDWWIKTLFKFTLFAFVLAINWWWCRNVLKMVWKSGMDRSNFHLDNSVLIALVSTSIANFLALVLVVARNLFPGKDTENPK